MAQAGFTAAELGWLSSGSRAAAYAETEWRLDGGSWRADIAVAGKLFDDGEVDIVVVVNPQAPWKPSFVLRIRRVWAARICVNRAHREAGQLIPPAPHLHTRRSSDHPESYAAIEDDNFPRIAVGAELHHGDCRRVLQYFAALYGIDLSALEWNDPPEGVMQ